MKPNKEISSWIKSMKPMNRMKLTPQICIKSIKNYTQLNNKTTNKNKMIIKGNMKKRKKANKLIKRIEMQ